MAIDKAKALTALDDGFAAAIGKLFGTLALNLIDGPASGPPPDAAAQRRFAKGLEDHKRAHALASAEITRLFPE